MKQCQKCGKLISDSVEYSLCTKCYEKVENTESYKAPTVKSNKTIWFMIALFTLLTSAILISIYYANRHAGNLSNTLVAPISQVTSEINLTSNISSLTSSENETVEYPTAEQTFAFDKANSIKARLVFNENDLATVQCFFDGKNLDLEMFRVVTIAKLLSDAGYGNITIAVFSGLDFGIINYKDGEMAFDENYPKPYLSITKAPVLQDDIAVDLKLITAAVDKLLEDYANLDK